MINRTECSYIDLPPELAEKRSKTAKLQVSITINCPSGMEKKYKKLIDELQDDAADKFKKFTKKQIKRATEE